ncbi:minor capsid protein [Desulfosporosinus youngiae]|uniref:Phage putative head morphogenesis protein, SPP1 gp7 family n=1 Tax=Desulfosporosinus youngiae DSM 17734 TaxID=768710 RepID=H5XZV7_9FIRM|nr:minor capsid protein [Desulfosporosinus youngiae]EHQ92153.1 phage putative head morphogenesis protein, SPP1 gp7 family [Desulfosporosinus youngiae DSM 17734]
MKPAEYWQKRFEQLAQSQFDKADEYTKALRKEYDRAIRSIQRDIEVFYQRYADNNGIVDLAEAKRQLNAKELKEFRWTLEEFMEKAKDNADGRWTQQLDNAYYRTRVSRFEALQMQINQQVEMLAGSKQQGTGDLLGSAYTDTYYRTLFEIQSGTGIGVSFARVDHKGLETVLKAKLDGANWSQRIWNDRDKLKQELYTKLSQSFIRGDSIDRTTQDLAKRMNVSYSKAYRLVQTETAFFVEQATMNSYSESGVVDRYEFLATLELGTKKGGTCEICQGLDGKVFKISEQEIGINNPPIHCHCRCTTVPYFDDDEGIGERIARDPKTRETYTVSENMTYPEWYKKHVVDKYGQGQTEIMQKKAANVYSDQEQYARYKKILGKDAPKTFDDFRDLKYTEAEKWGTLKADYRKLNAYDKIIAKEPGITKDLKEVSEATKTEMVGLDYRIKSKESYLRKVNMDSKESLSPQVIDNTISGTNDVIRYTYQAPHSKLVGQYAVVNQALAKKGYSLVKLKNTWPVKANPYKGINCTYQSPNGQKFEVQYHTPESFKLKNGEMHSLYEKWRLMKNKADPEAVKLSRQMNELSKNLKVPDGIETLR